MIKNAVCLKRLNTTTWPLLGAFLIPPALPVVADSASPTAGGAGQPDAVAIDQIVAHRLREDLAGHVEHLVGFRRIANPIRVVGLARSMTLR